MKTAYSAIFLSLLLSACASLTASHEQEITITTTPPGAACVLTNPSQTHTIDSTPGTVTVERMFEPLAITCTLAGYPPAEMLLSAQTRGRAYGNILLGGVPAVVDASTGAGYEYSPSEVVLTFSGASGHK
jgi:hypothetical protein